MLVPTKQCAVCPTCNRELEINLEDVKKGRKIITFKCPKHGAITGYKNAYVFEDRQSN